MWCVENSFVVVAVEWEAKLRTGRQSVAVWCFEYELKIRSCNFTKEGFFEALTNNVVFLGMVEC